MAKVWKKLRALNSKKAEEKPFVQEPEIIVELKFNAHCNNCCKQVKNCIKKFKGVVDVGIDEKKSFATVEGNFNVAELKEHIFKKLKKRVEILNQAHPNPSQGEAQDDDGK